MLPLLIRLGFVLATLLLVVVPLGLLAAAVRRPAVRGHLLAYWRASSLLMITVYLMIDGRPGAFVAGNAALLLIPIALYAGDALFRPGQMGLGDGAVAMGFRGWRVAATGVCGASLLLTLPALRCVGGALETMPFCTAWVEPPRMLHRALHPSADPALLGDVATAGLVVYGAYLAASVPRVVHTMRRSE